MVTWQSFGIKNVYEYVFIFYWDHHIIARLQLDLVPRDSTVNLLADVYNAFCKALNERKEVRAIVGYISKVLGRVWHKGTSLQTQNGWYRTLLNWFADWVHNRYQRVVLPGANSNWETFKTGIPLGSIWGPPLFLIYLSDIDEAIHSSIRIFAVDTSLYIVVDDKIQAPN